MDGIDREQDASVAAVAELLRRERATLSYDELQRVDRRLNRLRPQPRAPRRSSRVVVAISLAVGLLLMTAGTGLAISGFATPGAAVQAQYPDSHTGAPPASGRPPGSGGGHPPGIGAGPASAGRRRYSGPSTLGQEPRDATPTTTVELELTHAETRDNLPFTGVDAIPILLAGIVVVISATGVNRRTRGSWRRI